MDLIETTCTKCGARIMRVTTLGGGIMEVSPYRQKVVQDSSSHVARAAYVLEDGRLVMGLAYGKDDCTFALGYRCHLQDCLKIDAGSYDAAEHW